MIFSGNGTPFSITVVNSPDALVPVVGNYGDGRSDYAVFDKTTDTYTVDLATTLQQITPVQLGNPYDAAVPVVADVNGDGAEDFVVWNPLTATFSAQLSSTGQRLSDVSIGQSTDGLTPVVGDFDGDRKQDFVVYDDSGAFYAAQLSTQPTKPRTIVQIGPSNEVLVPL